MIFVSMSLWLLDELCFDLVAICQAQDGYDFIWMEIDGTIDGTIERI